MSKAQSAALYSLICRWHPVAIRPEDKRPMLTGWQTTPLEQTIDTLNANSHANIGIAVPSGFVVLDVDTKSGGPATLAALESEHSKLPATLTATTPTGGSHIWFALPHGAHVGNKVAIAQGLDVRANGGYVVAPP
ncbi:MAG: bifunctional DNA primase/polymerase, partial [Patescibacteria group bacterium]|nr:bifunctional DNA primase/polymerase [Patescibacteria group bacterium]